MDWEHIFGDGDNTVRMSVTLSLQQWMLGVVWSNQDLCIYLLCLSVSFDWFAAPDYDQGVNDAPRW